MTYPKISIDGTRNIKYIEDISAIYLDILNLDYYASTTVALLLSQLKIFLPITSILVFDMFKLDLIPC